MQRWRVLVSQNAQRLIVLDINRKYFMQAVSQKTVTKCSVTSLKSSLFSLSNI